MADYPTTPVFHVGSGVAPREDILVDTASDGTVRTRIMAGAQVYDLTLVHDLITEAEALTLEQFYETNRAAQIDVTWRAVVYQCRFVRKPAVDFAGGSAWRVVSTLVGVRADGL